MSAYLKTILEQLQEKNVYQASQQEVVELQEKYSTEKEFKTGITGPIKILLIEERDKRLVLETDQKGSTFIRIVEKEYIKEFVNERLDIYDRMWDGCGCKVFYNETWIPNHNKKTVEL